MGTIKDLKGFCYPLTPYGKSSLLGAPPWHYGTEYMSVVYRTDPNEIAKYLPEPMEPGPYPDLAYVAFSKWNSVWDGQKDLVSTHPERTQYKEVGLWVSCSYQGKPAQMCLLIWVDNDFSLVRGWAMGFGKKFGKVGITEYSPYNPAFSTPEEEFSPVGKVYSGYALSHDERLIQGSITIEKQITKEELPYPIGLPVNHIRHFPSIVKGEKPSVLELVSLGAENWKWDPVVWQGKGTLDFFASDLEDHMPLAPKEILGAYIYKNGYTFDGGSVLHDWRSEL